MEVQQGVMDTLRQIHSVYNPTDYAEAVLVVVKGFDDMAVVHCLSGEELMTEEQAKTVVVNMLIGIVNRLTTVEEIKTNGG